MNLQQDEWLTLSTLLDEALAIAPQQRQAWLDARTDIAPKLLSLAHGLIKPQTGSFTLPAMPAYSDAELHALGPADAMALAPGMLVGPYRLLRELGRGGMGIVWLASRSDAALKREVALKLPHSTLSQQQLTERFARERDILAALVHPHIARLYDAGLSESGQPYLALEYVNGEPIGAYCKTHQLDIRARLELFLQILAAVQYAHNQLVVHRDLKPSNVMVTADGQVRLLDFGVAKLLTDGQAMETELTQLSGRALTPQYAAPEQILGQSIGTAADVYALGVLLYELLTGVLPYRPKRDSRGALEDAILETDAVPPSRALETEGEPVIQRRLLQGDLDAVILKALKKRPTDRYATVSAFAGDLDRWMRGDTVLAQPDSGWYRTQKFVGRHKLAVFSGTAMALMLATFAAVALVMGLRANAESARAIAAREFLIDMFRQTDPDLVQGKTVSARQLLEQGRKTIVDTMPGHALLQAELLRGMGDALSSMEAFDEADKAYSDAARLYTLEGKRREAAHTLLDQSVVAGDALENATKLAQLLAEADQLYPVDRADEDYRARHLIQQMTLAFLRGDMTRQRDLVVLAGPIADSALDGLDSRTVHALRTLAEGEGQMGLYQSGIDRLKHLMTRLEKVRATPPAQILGILDDLAELEFNAGRFLTSAQRYEAADLQCRKQLNPNGSQCDFTQYGRARALLVLGENGRAMDTLPNLLNKSKGWQPTNVIRAYAVLAKNRLLAQYPEVAAAVRAIGQPGPGSEASDRTRFLALMAQAEYHLQEQQPDAASSDLEQAQSSVESGHLTSWYLTNRLLMCRGLLEQLQGHADAALVTLQQATTVQAKVAGPEHPATLLISLHQVRALWASNQREKALALMDHALPLLAVAIGQNAPTFVKLTELRQSILRSAPTAATARRVDLYL